MKTPTRELNERQRQIIAAAIELLEAGGMEAVTVKAIGARVGFSDAAVYRHFESKGAILAAIADQFAEGSLRLLEGLAATGHESLPLVRSFFLDRLNVFATDPVALAVMFAENLFRAEPELAVKVDQIMAAHREILMEALVTGQRRGEIRPLPPEHLFLLVTGSLRLLVLQWRASQRAFDLPAAGLSLWTTLEAVLKNPSRGDS